jgi:hypothetical protein
MTTSAPDEIRAGRQPRPSQVISVLGGPSSDSGGRQRLVTISDAQREVRTRYVGGYYGQLVSGVLWLLSASFAVWVGPRAAISTLVIGGFLIFPLTELLLRISGEKARLSPDNTLRNLGMQVAFVLPLSMPLLIAVSLYRLNWFYPGLMILLGAHYLPFVFLYGMRMFWALGSLLVGGGLLIAMYLSSSFSVGAWYTGVVLLVFAGVGRAVAQREDRDQAVEQEGVYPQPQASEDGLKE